MVEEWRALAEGLGWPLAFVNEARMFGWSFASFERALREPRTPAPKPTPWIHGYARDGFVIVRPMPFYEVTTDSLMERGFGSGIEGNPPPLHTIAMARIDPPLFAGLQLVTRPSSRFGYTGHWRFMRIARSDLSAQVWASAHDADRVNQLFSYGIPNTLLRPMFRFGTGGIALHDGVVEVFVPGIPNVAYLRELCEWAAHLGAELSMLSNALPLRMLDAPLAEQWAEVASARSLSFDPKRWCINGLVDDLEIEARLESGHGRLATSVHAKLRSPLACGISLRKALATEHPWFFGHGPGNVFVGKKPFDDDFVIDAIDVDGAEMRFSQSGVTETLGALGREGTQVLLDDANLFVADDGCSGSVRLAHRIDAVLAMVNALTPSLRGGAYR